MQLSIEARTMIQRQLTMEPKPGQIAQELVCSPGMLNSDNPLELICAMISHSPL